MDRMMEKAWRIKCGRVERLDRDRFNVIGDYGTYTVVRSVDGRLACNCPGFVKKGRCSHWRP